MTQASTEGSEMPKGVSYYEVHITLICPQDPYREAELKDRIERSHWKFSRIDGDIAMGAGIKCYATRHYNARLKEHDVVNRLHDEANDLELLGFQVIRRKVERVIYDSRSIKVAPGTCEGACVECHLDDYEEAQCSSISS